jgi:ETFB lysine methyltransferase
MSATLQTRMADYAFNGIEYRIRSLSDRNQFSDPDGKAEALGIPPALWPLFGMVWPSGLMLADIMSREGLAGLDILELGCGLGVASLVVNARGGEVLATDYHPNAEAFLDENSRLNGLSATPFLRCDWRLPQDGIGRFDLIIGSDLLYQPDHPEQLAHFISRHAKNSAQVIIVDPKRNLQGKFRRCMEALGYLVSTEQGSAGDFSAFGFKGVVFRFSKPH